MSKKELTPLQNEVKRPRPVYYAGPNQNCDNDAALDMIILYTYGGLGYSPIRHILGLKKKDGSLYDEKPVEDVIRQHGFGRSGVKGELGELLAPGKRKLSDEVSRLCKALMKKYGTQEDPYNVKMLKEGMWWNDPPYIKDFKCECGQTVDKTWSFCPSCGKYYE